MNTILVKANKARKNIRFSHMAAAATIVFSAINGPGAYKQTLNGSNLNAKMVTETNPLISGVLNVALSPFERLSQQTTLLCRGAAGKSDALCGDLSDGTGLNTASEKFEAGVAMIIGVPVLAVVDAAEAIASAPGRFIGATIGQMARNKKSGQTPA